MSSTIHPKYKYFHSTFERAKDRRQKFHFCRLPFDVTSSLISLLWWKREKWTLKRASIVNGRCNLTIFDSTSKKQKVDYFKDLFHLLNHDVFQCQAASKPESKHSFKFQQMNVVNFNVRKLERHYDIYYACKLLKNWLKVAQNSFQHIPRVDFDVSPYIFENLRWLWTPCTEFI